MSTKAQLAAFNEINGEAARSIEDAITMLIKRCATQGATKNELISYLKMRHQTITSRLSALQDKGQIWHADEIREKCTVFYITPADQVEEKRKARHFKKFQEFLNRGKKDFDLPDSVMVDLVKRYKEKHETPIKQNFAPFELENGNLFHHYHKIDERKIRVLKCSIKLTFEDIEVIRAVGYCKLFGKIYQIPEEIKNERFKAGIHQLTFIEL